MAVIFITMLFGAALIGLGALGYFGASPESQSLTAWIPAGFGAVLLAMGVWAAVNVKMRMHAMHIAVLFGALGCVGAGVMVVKAVWGQFAVLMQLLMAITCAVYLILCVRSFVAARRARKQEAKAA